jgi:arsenate reductase
LLEDHGVQYRYREYTKEPLSKAEIRSILAMLELTPHDLLRRNDKAFKELGLTGEESAAKLVTLMAEHPTLLQRPIGVLGKKAAVGRPVENLLALVGG